MSAARPRRLLMIEQGGRGGVADYTGALVAQLARDGWAVQLATADDHRYAQTEGVTVVPVFHYMRDDTAIGRALRSRGLGKPVNGIRFLLSLPSLMRLARANEIVHSQGWEIPQIGLVAMFCLRLTGTRIVQTAHGTFERSSRFLRLRRVVRALTARLTARTIVHTEADLARLAPAAARHAVVISHGEYGGLARTGGEADRDSSRAELGIAPDAPVTLMFGQLRSDKGLGDLIGAMDRVPALHLLIGGQEAGALAEHREALERLTAAGRVTLREGFLDMAEAARLFAASDTVALPYQVASQSGVLLLAYGFSRPVIVYPVGGMAEAVIDGETGWVCERADAEALTVALAASVEAGPQECARRGEAGSRLSEERYSWTAIAARTEALYEEVLSYG
jgi:glycosyltransferase involved in cell wall biosynthesis